MRYAILTVGHIHCGKTTFAKMLTKAVPELIYLERDPIPAMLNDNFPALMKLDVKNRAEGRETLKDKIYNVMLNEAIESEESNVLIATCHMHKKSRDIVIKKFKDHAIDVKTVMVHFDIDQDVLEERVRTSQRPTNILTVSKTFMENLEKQRKDFETPSPDEADYFFTVKNNKNNEEVIEKIKLILQ